MKKQNQNPKPLSAEAQERLRLINLALRPIRYAADYERHRGGARRRALNYVQHTSGTKLRWKN